MNNSNNEDVDPYPKEEKLTMTLQNNNIIDAGEYWISQGRRIVSTDWNGHFPNLPNNVVLNAIEWNVSELQWYGPITILPGPATTYYNHVINVSNITHANEAMHEWITNILNDDSHGTISQIRVYVADHIALGDIEDPIFLRWRIEQRDAEKQLTWWIFFEIDGGWEGIQICCRGPNAQNH